MRVAPETVRAAMRHGLAKVEQGLAGSGLEDATVQQARAISSGEGVSDEWVGKAYRFWARNARFLESAADSPAYVSALLWGGAAGMAWYRREYEALKQGAKTDADNYDAFAATYADVYEQTADELMSLQAAAGMQHRERLGMKRADEGTIVAGWGLRFSDANSLDSYGTYFDEATETLERYYAGAPLWYEHGLDPTYRYEPIGERRSIKAYPFGLYVTHRLHPEHPQFERTVKEIEAGQLSYSSDSISHFSSAHQRPDGGYAVWPLAGWSLIRNPAEPGLGNVVSFSQFDTAIKSLKVEAREAQHSEVRAVLQHGNDNRGNRMDKDQLIASLADALGVESTLDAVLAALRQAISELEGKPEEAPVPDEMKALDPSNPMPTVAGLKSQLGKLIDLIDPPKKLYNPNAMAIALELAAKSAPAPATALPFQTESNNRGFTPGKAPAHIGRDPLSGGLTRLLKGILDKSSESSMKSMGYNFGPSGRWGLRDEVAAEILDRFFAQSVVFEAGAERISMPAGVETITQRKIKSGTAGYWRGEEQVVTQSELQMGKYTLALKELVAATTVNRRLLRGNDIELERKLRDDMTRVLLLTADLAYLRGTGAVSGTGNTGGQPRGVINTPNVVSTVLDTNGRRPSPDDFIAAWGRIEDANVPGSDTWGLVSHPRTRRYIHHLRDTTGNLLMPDNFLDGHNEFYTTQMPINQIVGTTNDNAEVIFGDWSYLHIGIGGGLEFTVDNSIYVREGMVYFEASLMTDCAVSYPEAFQILTGVRAVA